MKYNLALRQPFKDAQLGPVMLARGKLGILGHKIKEVEKIKEIFQNSKRLFKP
jgi:hypothetical protein